METQQGDPSRVYAYQWMVTLYCARLTTLTTSVSPSLTSSVGPGNCPFTVMMLCVLHSLFTGVSWTLTTTTTNPKQASKHASSDDQMLLIMHTKTQQARHASYRCRGRDNEQIAYNELMVVHFGAGEQREREAREEEEQPGRRRRRRHGERRCASAFAQR